MERPAPSPRPPRITLVLAICAALGATGFSFGLAGLMAWNEPVPEQALRFPPAPPGEEAAWGRVEEAYRSLPELQAQVLRQRRPLLNALAGVNFIASAALLFGALVARIRRPNALSTLRTGLVLSQAYAALAAVVQTWLQFEVLQVQQPVLLPLLEEGGTVRSVAQLALGAQVGAVAITLGISLAQLAFYIWAHRWTRRPEVVKAMAPAAG